MKKLLLLLLIPFTSYAEEWACSYKSTEGPASDTTTFIRDGNQFVTDGILGPFSIAKENQYTIILVGQGISNFIVELKKDRPAQGSINFIDLSDMAQWTGKCLVANIKK